MTKEEPTQSWSVTVERNGEQVVTIASSMLTGRDLSPEDERLIRDAGRHLLSFIGVAEGAGGGAAPQWQPIETAPKDGTPLWLIEPGEPWGYVIPHQYVGFWAPDDLMAARGCWRQAYHAWVGNPTHWMPLPPSSTREE